MPLQPKFQRGPDGVAPGPRGFVDRQELFAAFEAALWREDRCEPKVLVFWGLAGIGKSRLKRELRERSLGRAGEAAELRARGRAIRQKEGCVL